MEISAEKTKLMTNNTSGINTEIKVNGQRLETVTSFKYLGSVVSDEGSKPEILSRKAETTAKTAKIVERLDKASTADGMDVSSISKDIKVNRLKLETVTSFKYLSSVVSDEGFKHEILSRKAQTTAALTRLKPVWNDRSFFFLSSKID